MKNQAVTVAIMMLLLGAGVWYLTSRGSQNINTSPQVTTQPSIENVTQVKTFDILGKPFEFSLKEIRVKTGDTVRINFTNTQGFHDWTVDEFNAKTKQLQAGQTDTVEFTADKAGTFEYYCSVSNHRQMGMKGNLIVEE